MPITIDGDGTITGVSVGGLPDGIVDTDMIAAGAVTAAKRGAGAILQVVQSTKTDTGSMTGLTFADLGLSVTITPSSSSSKILILCFASIAASVGFDCSVRLLRGSTAISVGDAAGNRTQSTSTFTGNWTTVQYARQNVAINYLDSPATTSATTYKIQGRSYDSSVVVYINRGHQDQDLAAYEARAASSIIAMEVAA